MVTLLAITAITYLILTGLGLSQDDAETVTAVSVILAGLPTMFLLQEFGGGRR